jgi:cobalt/nickel transport system ATP-binding protein
MKLRGYGQDGTPAPTTSHPAITTGSPALQITDLRFAYPHQPPVLDGIQLTLQPGERVGLIGPNGAGKTSLFLLVSGLLPPDAGSIALFGEPVKKGTFHPEVGLVFQNANDQLFSPTVQDDVAFGPTNMGLPADEIDRRVQAALHTTGMSDLADRAPHHLSGGEKRMVSIAGVIAMQPRLVIYDEPDANLDIRARRRLIRFLQEADHAQLIASHDLELILEACDRVLLLDGGTIVADGPAQDILGDEALMTAHGLEKPHSLIPHHNGHHH